ncbi:hypothetical protein MWU57_11825 [Isoptericola sp. S6320L]|uniref:hypothetical protein n=1 Tax=Isoptericola sp. S6320L TaxID=2926411 RepID=UPI001FF61624|nr:hypothetical protein [Isoptericola sp. S6320L]MCK0117720.1 hypothetical protein [Isoptericola sp. S6320L]
MSHDPAAPSGRVSSGGRIARRPDTGQVASIATLFPAEPDLPAGPGRGLVPRLESRGVQTAVLAAAVVLALVATVGVAVLWSANRKLAGEVQTAVTQAESAQAESARLRAELAAAPDAATVDALTGRVQSVEDWTGFPAEGSGGMDDLQTRLLEVTNGIDSLESNLQNGLGTVRNDLATVRDDLQTRPDAASAADVDALRQDVAGLRTAVDTIRQDVGTLCWALGYRTDVAASC